MIRFHASGTYQTAAGAIGSFAFMVVADSLDAASRLAERRVKADKRRRYARSLHMTVQQIPA